MNKNKYLTAEQRNEILIMLEKGDTISRIAVVISKDKSTISKEIKKHRVNRECLMLSIRMEPVHMSNTALVQIYVLILNVRLTFVRSVIFCQSGCPDFELYICKRLVRAPYVCNGCDFRKNCRKPIKFFYNPSHAQQEYEDILVNSRMGINVTKDELKKIDSIVSPLVKNKSQSLNHIFASHAEEISVSQSIIYNYIDNGYLECSNIVLLRRVRFKKRNTRSKKMKVNKSSLRKNRTYDDYLAYMSEHPDANDIKMNTVKSVKCENLLLTLHCVKTHFQITHFKQEKHTSFAGI